MHFVIKAGISNPDSEVFEFDAAKTMYGGKKIVAGDTAFVFASENEGGAGLIARGLVTYAAPVPKVQAFARQTPRVDVRVERSSTAKRRLGRSELNQFRTWNDGRPETELNFKLYRQATNKIVGISEQSASFLDGFF
jgi:hypothetical protein